ncbi:MAG: S41 family peptidase [Terriglobia bacterium]
MAVFQLSILHRQSSILPALLLLVVCFLGAVLVLADRAAAQAGAPSDIASDDLAQEGARFARVFGSVEANYVDPIDTESTIFNGAIRGMLAQLDPFSGFFDRDQFQTLKQQARGQALGFGSILYVQTGNVVVLETAQGSPSWRAGLGPGDAIVEINGERVDRLDFQSLVELLQRSRSQAVRLGVIHPGKLVSQDYDLKPAEVALPTVDKSFLLGSGVGYLHISGFELKTPQEVIDAIQGLGASTPQATAGIKSLLVDLRDNHGGIVGSAIATASLFLPPNVVVMTVRDRTGTKQTARTLEMPAHFDLPVVVLVNGETASAAELFAAALQDHDRAVVAGQSTYGKGLVQSVLSLSENTGLALTTAQYFTPSGRSIQRPLPGTMLGPTGGDDPAKVAFHTDDGRSVSAGGGITPDVSIPPRSLDPWAAFINQRGAFNTFASDYLSLHNKPDRSFEPEDKTLGEFRDFLAREGIRTPDEYWGPDQDYLKLRIKTEVLTLVYGLALGDETETKSDPQVQEAVKLFSQIPSLLKPGSKLALGGTKGH